MKTTTTTNIEAIVALYQGKEMDKYQKAAFLNTINEITGAHFTWSTLKSYLIESGYHFAAYSHKSPLHGRNERVSLFFKPAQSETDTEIPYKEWQLALIGGAQ